MGSACAKEDSDFSSEEGSSAECGSAGSGSESEGHSSSGASAEAKKPSMFQHLSGCMHRRRKNPQAETFIRSETIKVRQAPRPSRGQKALLVDNTDKALDDYFEVDRRKVVGEGGYATVCLGKDKRTGATRAVKCIKKDLVASKQRLQQEIDILMGLDHPNINKLYQTFEDHRYIYLVLELCAGGELFDRIHELGHLTERESAIIMEQIFKAVRYMHCHGVAHRDLKPENFLFLLKGPIDSNTLKVIDFGIAATFKSASETFSDCTGTPYYVAPEVLSFPMARYTASCDLWSCGVIMYVLLSGRLPFRGADDHSTFQKIKSGKLHFPENHFRDVSEDALKLIRRLLQRDPLRRFSAERALNDPWTKGHAPKAKPAPLLDSVVSQIREFNHENKLKKAALHVVARQLDETQIKQLRNTFMDLDVNGDGHLTSAELSEGLRRADLGKSLPEDLTELIKGLDADGSGEIDYTEFLAATLERRHYNNESICWAAFRVFDKNDDGKISPKELADVLRSQDVVSLIGGDSVNALMAQVDQDGDGYIDFEEFMAMMRAE